MTKLLQITVRGKRHTWAFEFYGDPQFIEDWRADGLDVCEVVNTVPEWAARLRLVRPWCFFQDLFNFKNPFNQ